jgi:hypothetical protein
MTVRTWWEWRLELVGAVSANEPEVWRWVRVRVRSDGK